MHLMCLYSARWEAEAPEIAQRAVEARQAWPARDRQQASRSGRSVTRTATGKMALRRLVTARAAAAS